jgi:hypothetical protein
MELPMAPAPRLWQPDRMRFAFRARQVTLALAAWWLIAGIQAPAADSAPPPPWPLHTLQADRTWLLNLPQGQRLDASALLRRPDGTFLTVNDQDSVVYSMRFLEGTNAIDLTPLPECLTREQLAPFAAQKFKRYDLEGLAQDREGRLYICEEGNRWILRWDPRTTKVERLNIDWKPVERWFSAADSNASLEGIAIGGDRLYVANERQIGRVIVVDLATLKVIDDFMVAPAGSQSTDVHYTDLCWADDALWVLLRDDRKLLKVDPTAKRVLAEFDFTAMERSRENAYGALFAPGFMEGVWVDQDFIWLLSDNNGMGRKVKLSDKRPTLFRCPKPR